MVAFARFHNPSHCLPLNNRNEFGDGSVAAQAHQTECDGDDSPRCDDDEDDRKWPKQSSSRVSRQQRRAHHRANVRGHCDATRNKKKRAQLWFRAADSSCNLSVSLVFCAAISLLLLNIDVITAEPQHIAEQQCEPKVLEEMPPDPVSIDDKSFIPFDSIHIFATTFFFSVFALLINFNIDIRS